MNFIASSTKKCSLGQFDELKVKHYLMDSACKTFLMLAIFRD